MRLQAYNDNGTMKFRQVSGSQALDSLPVGTTIGRIGGVIPNGYLEADGSTFDTAKYPELYSKLGSDTLPELFDHNKPSDYETFTGNIVAADYDGEVFIIGTSSATQGMTITININGEAISSNTAFVSGFAVKGSADAMFKKGDSITITATNATSTLRNIRYYKQHLLIKAATIGIADIDINTIKNSLSYSTDEVLTGGTWIDGKPIYRKVIQVNQAAPATIPTGLTNVDFIDVRVKANYQGATSTTGTGHSFYVSNELNNQVGGQPYYFGEENVLWKVTSSFTGYVYWVILEYTKQ